MTADPLAGDDDKFEPETFANPRVRRSVSSLLHFFKGVIYIMLSAAGNDTPNEEPIHWQIYNEHLFWK